MLVGIDLVGILVGVYDADLGVVSVLFLLLSLVLFLLVRVRVCVCVCVRGISGFLPAYPRTSLVHVQVVAVALFPPVVAVAGIGCGVLKVLAAPAAFDTQGVVGVSVVLVLAALLLLFFHSRDVHIHAISPTYSTLQLIAEAETVVVPTSVEFVVCTPGVILEGSGVLPTPAVSGRVVAVVVGIVLGVIVVLRFRFRFRYVVRCVGRCFLDPNPRSKVHCCLQLRFPFDYPTRWICTGSGLGEIGAIGGDARWCGRVRSSLSKVMVLPQSFSNTGGFLLSRVS